MYMLVVQTLNIFLRVPIIDYIYILLYSLKYHIEIRFQSNLYFIGN